MLLPTMSRLNLHHVFTGGELQALLDRKDHQLTHFHHAPAAHQLPTATTPHCPHLTGSARPHRPSSLRSLQGSRTHVGPEDPLRRDVHQPSAWDVLRLDLVEGERLRGVQFEGERLSLKV